MRPGEDLESLTQQIFRIMTSGPEHIVVERNVALPGADGPRQIDVVVRSSVGPISLTTIIECKDHDRKIDVTKVDALHSVLQDVRASKGVLVSRKGFSSTAVTKAKRLGISLLLADRLANLKGIELDVPVHVREVRQVDIQMAGKLYFDAGTTIDKSAFWKLNDADMIGRLRDELFKNPLLAERAGRNVWRPEPHVSPWFIRDVLGKRWDFEDLEISYLLTERHFFGFLRDLDTVLYLRDEIEKKSQVLLPVEALSFDYTERFAQFDRKEDLPLDPRLSVQVVVLPDRKDIISSNFGITPAK